MRRERPIQAIVPLIAQPHYPQKSFSVSEWLPLFHPFSIHLYHILIGVIRQVAHQSSGGGDRFQWRADGTVEGVPVPPRRPTPPSDARVHRAGAPAPALDGSSGRDWRVGCSAREPVLQATIRWARVRRGT